MLLLAFFSLVYFGEKTTIQLINIDFSSYDALSFKNTTFLGRDLNWKKVLIFLKIIFNLMYKS
jgi:hypothetical protein